MTRSHTTLVGTRMSTMLLFAVLALSCGRDREDLAQFLAREKALYAEGPLAAFAGRGELLIRHFFRNRRAGFYVDIGCSDYKVNSTTYYLEEHLEWSGIGVDALIGEGPLPELGAKLCIPRAESGAAAPGAEHGHASAAVTAGEEGFDPGLLGGVGAHLDASRAVQRPRDEPPAAFDLFAGQESLPLKRRVRLGNKG